VGAAEWTEGFEFTIFPLLLLKVINTAMANIILTATRLKNYVEISETNWTVIFVFGLFGNFCWQKICVVYIVYIILRF
jgi:hypothetical protein